MVLKPDKKQYRKRKRMITIFVTKNKKGSYLVSLEKEKDDSILELFSYEGIDVNHIKYYNYEKADSTYVIVNALKEIFNREITMPRLCLDDTIGQKDIESIKSIMEVLSITKENVKIYKEYVLISLGNI